MSIDREINNHHDCKDDDDPQDNYQNPILDDPRGEKRERVVRENKIIKD